MFQALVEIVAGFGAPRVAVMGDFMLDRYIYGDAERISPEAPVPVIRVVDREARTGGAGNVVAGVLALGGRAACIGVIGQDEAGGELNQLLAATGAETPGLVRLPQRATTVKTRYVGLAQHRHRQQMLRVDQEADGAVPEAVHATLRTALLSRLRNCDVLALEDYDKGVLTDRNTPRIIADAVEASVPVVVDPAAGVDYSRYEGATLLTPNRREAGAATGVEISDDASLEAAAWRIIDVTGAQGVVITLDREGAYLLERGGGSRRVATRPRSVYDVTGAGDEVLAMLAVAVAEKCQLADAVALANIAGGLEVERFGVVPVRREELVDELRRMIGLRGGKVMARERLLEELAHRRRQGQTAVFTNGCFDLLHLGHVRYLQESRELGNLLIVAVNSDQSVQRLKGAGRPVIGQQERAETLAALECVDYVTIFDEDTPEVLLELLTPEVLVKGGTTGAIVGQEIVEGYGGRVHKLPVVDGLSTTKIINRIVDNSDPS